MPNDTAFKQLNELLALLDGAYAPNTLRAYKADMLEFIAYCIKVDEHALPAHPDTVATFLMRTLDQGIKSSSHPRFVEKFHPSAPSIAYFAMRTPPNIP
jgi:site-specific recombinase XerD